MKNPKMLFKCPGKHTADGIAFDYIIVEASDVELHPDWFTTLELANKPKETALPKQPERIELIQHAEKIGVKIDKRWSDARIISEISAHAKA